MPASVRIVALIAVVTAGAPADALDWRVNGFATQRFSVDGAAGGTDGDRQAESSTSIGLVIAADGRSSSLSLAPGVTFLASTEDDFDLSRVTPRLGASFSHAIRTTTLSGSLSVTPTLTNSFDEGFDLVSDPADPSLPPRLQRRVEENDVLQLTSSARFSVRHEVDRDDTATLGFTVQRRDYPDGATTLSETQTLGLSGSWRRAVDNRTGLSLTVGGERFSDAESGDEHTANVRIGGDRRLSRRLSARGSVGVSQAFTDDGAATNAIGDFGLTYAGRTTTAFVGASQTVDQDDFGVLTAQLSLRGGLQHTVNDLIGLSLNGGVSLDNPVIGSGDGAVSAFLSPNLSLRVTERWSLSLGYQVRYAEDDTDAVTDRAFLQISRNLSLLP